MGKKTKAGKKAGKLVVVDTETCIAFQEIEKEARDLMIRQLLKRLTRLQCRVIKLQDGFDENLEGIVDHLTQNEIDFILEIRGIIGKAIIGKPTKATLMEAIKAIDSLTNKKMSEIENGAQDAAKPEEPGEEQKAGDAEKAGTK